MFGNIRDTLTMLGGCTQLRLHPRLGALSPVSLRCEGGARLANMFYDAGHLEREAAALRGWHKKLSRESSLKVVLHLGAQFS